MAEKKMVTVSRMKYFHLTTGRSPNGLEILQNSGFIEIPIKELEDLQAHIWDSRKNYMAENG